MGSLHTVLGAVAEAHHHSAAQPAIHLTCLPLSKPLLLTPLPKPSALTPEQAGPGADREAGETDAENNFTPPIDVFYYPAAYVLHVALPGAKKEDVGVNWDAEKSELNVAGVVYRQGDEEFLKTLSKKERKV